MTPKGQYERLSAKAPYDPQRAELFRSDGTWWLRYEDGHETDTYYTAGGPVGFRKADMIGVVRDGK